MTTSEHLPMCPMAETCKGMMKKPPSGVGMFVPGIVFIVFGVLIVIEPTILVWLVALAFIGIGFGMLFMANFVRKFGTRMRSLHT